MPTVDVSMWERLLEAVVDLGVLPEAGVSRSGFARELLRAGLLVPGVDQGRCVFLGEDHAWSYGLLDEDAAVTTDRFPASRVRCLTLGDRPWRSQRPHSPELEVLLGSSLAQEIVVAPFLVSTFGAKGALVVWSTADCLPPETEKVLGLLARHAEHLQDHARVLQSLEHEASTDGLTGALNYRHFMDALQTEVKRAERFEERFSVLMVDVDNLKEYNDRHGHLAGSNALKEIAQLLLHGAREIDVVAKYGGDEFSVILPNTSLAGAMTFAERMLDTVRDHPLEGNPERALTVSVGIAQYPTDGTDPRALLSSADQRLYAAKAAGRDRIGVESVAMSQTTSSSEGNHTS